MIILLLKFHSIVCNSIILDVNAGSTNKVTQTSRLINKVAIL